MNGSYYPSGGNLHQNARPVGSIMLPPQSGNSYGIAPSLAALSQPMPHPVHQYRYDTCPICLEDRCNLQLFCCSHGVCIECRERLRTTMTPRCPMCRTEISACLVPQPPAAVPLNLSTPMSSQSAERIVRELQTLRRDLVVELRMVRQALEKVRES